MPHMDDIDDLIDNLDDGTNALTFPEAVKDTKSTGHVGKTVPEDLLQTDKSLGLTTAEVIKRAKIYGSNELSETKEPNFIKKILYYFKGPVQYVMIAAAVLAAGLQLWLELGIIIALLILNATVGYIQESKAGNVVAELRKSVASKTNVIRNGVQVEIAANLVVPGDIIPLEEGCIIPADGKILDQEAFMQVDQSPLTGESLPAEKRYLDVVYSSSVVKRGEGLMIVTAIGDDTFVGVTASLVSKTDTQGHFQKVLFAMATILLVLVVICISIIWISGFFRSLGMYKLLLYTFEITVIGVPLGLPVVVTTTMAVGAAELARKKVIVQRLAAIESLAGVDILCSDKTGTLTQNKLTMGTPYVVSGVAIEDLLLTSVLASSRKLRGLDPIDKTIILSLKQYPDVKEEIKHFETLEFFPFDPVSKKVRSVVKDNLGDTYTCVKGAPASIITMVQEAATESGTPLNEAIVTDYNSKVEEFASRGFRSLGVARKKDDGPWMLLGILQLFDPPRYDTLETIEEAKNLGLEIKMLTGDAVGIAKETCRQLNLGNNVFSIKRLIAPDANGVKMTGSQFNDFVEAADGFAEVFPQHKHMVVEVLQRRGHLVAMTGDGMNDAPSLKKADAGIAVEGASEAARSAADIVFLNAGLSTIIDALKTSRMIFHRMRAYVVYRIALSIHLEIFLVTSIVILNTSIPPALVAILAIFADIATLAIAYDNATYSSRPTQWRIPALWGTSILLGVFLAIGTWIIFATTFISGTGIVASHAGVEEILFLEISLTQNWLIFITRCDGPFWMSMPSFQLLGAVLAVDIAATLIAAFGWFGGSAVDIVTIVKIWVYSFCIFAGLGLIHRWFHSSKVFNKIVKRKPHHNKYEDLIYNLERVALMHEKGNGKNGNGNGNGYKEKERGYDNYKMKELNGTNGTNGGNGGPAFN